MTIDWPYFLAALMLLWLPRQVLRFGRKKWSFGRRRRRLKETDPAKAHESGDLRVHLGEEFGKLRNHIDFFRAGLGAVMLLGTFEGITAAVRADVEAYARSEQLVLVVKIAVLLVGVLVQVFRYEHRIAFYAPIFYLSGLSVGMCGVYPALVAMVLVWVINLALLRPAAFLSLQALLVLTTGVLFRGVNSWLPYAAAVLMLLPVALSLLSRRRLGMFSKRMKA